jgi:hypothetical protein
MFMIPDLRRFTTPGLCRFMIPDLRRFMIPDIRRFTTRSSQVHGSRRFTNSITLERTVDSREIARFRYYFRILFENLFHEIRQTRHYKGVWFLLNSPTATSKVHNCIKILSTIHNLVVVTWNITTISSKRSALHLAIPNTGQSFTWSGC